MKTLQARIPEALYDRVAALVEEGWFRDRGEVLGEALRRFIESHQGSLAEKFVRKDVEWGLRGDYGEVFLSYCRASRRRL